MGCTLAGPLPQRTGVGLNLRKENSGFNHGYCCIWLGLACCSIKDGCGECGRNVAGVAVRVAVGFGILHIAHYELPVLRRGC